MINKVPGSQKFYHQETHLRTQNSELRTYQIPGDSSGEALPDPIPNSVVKLSSADDTALEVGK